VAGIAYTHTDMLGSPVARSQGVAGGGSITNTRFEPYGAVAQGFTPNQPYVSGFTGHVQDGRSGLVYMQQRYYDPVAGRFMSVDPVVTDRSSGIAFGRFTYAANNPYVYVDPDGRFEKGDSLPWKDQGLGLPSHSQAKNEPSASAAFSAAVAIEMGGAGASTSAGAGAGASAFAGLLARLLGAASLALTPSELGADDTIDDVPINLLKSDSRELGQNLVAVGAVRQKNDEAHHIVAVSDVRAEPARKILARVGMSINDPNNGVFLSNGVHRRVHSGEYYNAVNAALAKATTYKAAAETLFVIGGAIRLGKFP